jgi:acyl-CoA thioesterase I
MTPPVLFLLTLACHDSTGKADGPELSGETAMLGVGDSYFAWNLEEGESIPEVAGAELGLETFNLAVSGATVLGEEEEGGLVIPNQYVSEPWTWVVMDGGGNDVEGDCACGDCGDVVDRLLAADGTGAIPDLVDRALDDGAKVAWVGYPNIPESRQGYIGCDDEQAQLIERLEELERDRDGLIFVDGRDAFGPDELEFFDGDHVHPSVEGSRALGALVAERIRESGLD